MLVLGIDPGTATTGYGLLEVNGKLDVREFGLIETAKELAPEVRLAAIFESLNTIIKRFSPDVLAMEKVFFATNAKTAIRVGQAQGVILLSAAQASIPVMEYAPGTIKKIITGDGRAKKDDIKKSVRALLGPRVRSRKHKKTHFDNEADALAVAVCHVYQAKLLTNSLSLDESGKVTIIEEKIEVTYGV